MAEGALGISTGIGQGEAQIIKPFQSPVTPQQYGAVMAAQQKAQQEAAAKKAKAAASIADFQFKGLPQHAELFAKGYNDVVNFAVENIDDPLIEFKLKQKMADLNTKANMSADLKANLQKQSDFVQQGQGKNYFLGFDEAVKDVVNPIDYATFQDTNKFGQAIGNKAALLNNVKTVPIYDTGAAKKDLQDQISGWAKDNMQGKSWEATDKIINTFVENELIGHPEAITHFDKVMKTDPAGAKAAGNDPYQYGFNTLKKDLQAKGYTTGGNTNVNVNLGGGEDKSFDAYPVTQQAFKEAWGVGNEKRDVIQNVAMYPTPVEHGTFKVPVGGTVNGEPSDGTTVVKNVKFNLTKEKAVMDEDITYNKNGVKVTVKKGQVINVDDIPTATRVLGRPPKFEYKYISEGFTPTGQIVNVDAELIAPASVAALKGQTGKGALGVYQEQSNKELQDKGAKTIGGTKTTIPKGYKSSYMLNGKDVSYDRLFERYGTDGINKLIKAGKIK
jgi:hypothetical protein